MNMRILAILFIVLHFASPFFAQDATRVLDNAVKKIKSDEKISMELELVVYDIDGSVAYTDKGSLFIDNSVATKKERFALFLNSMKVWCNGKKQWNYMPQTNEIYITEADTQEAQMFSPVYIMQLYKQNYKSSIKRDGKYDVVTLVPNNEDEDYEDIVVYLDANTSLLDRIELSMGQGGSARIVVKNYKTGCDFDKSQFVCPVEHFPNAEIVDMMP